MSSGCGDVLSLVDLQTAKKHQIFEAEVITGKFGGVAGGADIDYATNQVTGQTQKTLPAVLRDLGFSPVAWDFSTGGTLTAADRDKVVYDPVSKTWYSYAGTLPVTVPAGFNPVGNAGWKPVTDVTLREYVDGRVTSYNVEFFGFTTGYGSDINKLLDAFNEAEHLIFGKGTYYVDDFTMPSTAKCKMITILPGSRVQQNGLDCVFNVTDNFTINMHGGGCWHGGLKKALVAADAPVGATQIQVDDGSVFSVGDQITTSFLIPGNPGDEGDPNTWKWSNSPRYGEFNYITAINGNTITVKNPVENRTLMRNVYVGNWMFSHQGLAFKGSGKVFINGGDFKEFKTYGLTLVDVDCIIDGTHISGMTIDCIYMIGSASLTMRNFRFETCYDFGKLGIIHTSTGNITLEDGYWRRGNFDADINHSNQTDVTKFGKVILRNVTAVGTSTLRLPGDQVDTFTGQTANQIFGGRINPARVFCTTGNDSRDFEGQGFEAVNCSFLDYQRQVYGPEGAYPANFRIDNLIMRDVTAACGLFNIQVASGKDVVIRRHELRDLSVTRKYTVNFYPLFYISGGFLSFSGLLKYDNGGHTGVDHRIETENAYIPEMEITGAGDSILVSPTFIDSLVVRSASVTKRLTGQRNDFTNLVLLQGASITGDLRTHPSRLHRLRTVDIEFNANDSSTWLTLYTNTDALTSADVRIELAPRKTINASAGISGVIGAKLNKTGTTVPVVTNADTYLSAAIGNIAFWEGKVIGTQGAIADGTVSLRCLATGEVQININAPSLMACTAFVAGV